MERTFEVRSGDNVKSFTEENCSAQHRRDCPVPTIVYNVLGENDDFKWNGSKEMIITFNKESTEKCRNIVCHLYNTLQFACSVCTRKAGR